MVHSVDVPGGLLFLGEELRGGSVWGVGGGGAAVVMYCLRE